MQGKLWIAAAAILLAACSSGGGDDTQASGQLDADAAVVTVQEIVNGSEDVAEIEDLSTITLATPEDAEPQPIN